MKTSMIPIAAASLCLIAGCDWSAPSAGSGTTSTTDSSSPAAVHPPAQPVPPAPAKPPAPEDYDKTAYHLARQAVEAAMVYNWTSAGKFLSRIDETKLKSVDVVFYVDYAKRTVDVAEKLGVSKDSDPDSLIDTTSNLDPAKLVATLWKTLSEKGFAGTAQLAADAKAIKDEIPKFQEADGKLLSRYGPEPE